MIVQGKRIIQKTVWKTDCEAKSDLNKVLVASFLSERGELKIEKREDFPDITQRSYKHFFFITKDIKLIGLSLCKFPQIFATIAFGERISLV